MVHKPNLAILFFPLVLAAAWGLVWGTPVGAQGTATETIDFLIQVEQGFHIDVSSEETSGDWVSLGPIVPGGAGEIRRVTVTIRTNAERPYRIVQRVDHPPTNAQGNSLPLAALEYAVSDGVHGGTSQVNGFQPVTPGTTVLFSSGPKGKSDRFTITYRSSSPHILPAGTYRARLNIEGELL